MYQINSNPGTGGYYTVVKKNNQYYYIDLSEVWRIGPECMAFPSDENGNVTDWGGVWASFPSQVSPENLKKCVDEFINNSNVG